MTHTLYNCNTCRHSASQVSYDWSRGYAEYNPTTAKHYIMLHQPLEAEVKNRARPARR